MISASRRGAYATPFAAVRRLSLGLLLLTVPACGLSDYEKLMDKAQESKKRFDEEEMYLGDPVKMPTQKNKDNRDVPVANVFFRPPKGVEVKPQSQPRGGLNVYRYARGKGESNFSSVELVFAEDSKDFVNTVVSSYGVAEQKARNRSVQPPDRERPVMFEAWDASSDQSAYSVNVLMGSKKPVAIIFHYYTNKKDKEYQVKVNKAIELSLQSLAIDKEVNPAREVYNRRSPWRLETQPSEESEP